MLTDAPTTPGYRNYGTFTATASDHDPHVTLADHDPYNIIYSSGTTGLPKGIVHTHYIRKHVWHLVRGGVLHHTREHHPPRGVARVQRGVCYPLVCHVSRGDIHHTSSLRARHLHRDDCARARHPEVAVQHHAVRETTVFGIPDEMRGEVPLAAIILKQSGAATPEELRQWINERVAVAYQKVYTVVIMEDFPRRVAGKTLKRVMREPYWAEQGTHI